MPRFFVGADQVVGGRATVLGDDATHLTQSLRVRAGERIRIVDDAGREHEVVVDTVSTTEVGGRVARTRPAAGEPRLRVEVLQALAQGGIDDALAAMVEVGVAAIRPVITERTVVRPQPGRPGARVARWEAIVREAAMLAHRGALPTVHPPVTLAEAVAALPTDGRLIALDPGAATPLAGLRLGPVESVAAVIGPEGGLTGAELAALDALGASRVHIGSRILRARLAGVVVTALLLNASGDLDAGPPGWAGESP